MITNHPTMTEFEVQRSKLTDILNNHTSRVVKNTSCLEANQLLIYKTQPRSWICSNWGQIQPKAGRKCWTQDHKTMSPFRAIRTQLCCSHPPHPFPGPWKKQFGNKKNECKRCRNGIRNNFSSVENVYHFLLHCSVPLDLTICETAGQ